MALRLLVTLMAKPGMRDDYAKALKGTIDITHGEDGCEQYELCFSTEDPHKMVLGAEAQFVLLAAVFAVRDIDRALQGLGVVVAHPGLRHQSDQES